MSQHDMILDNAPGANFRADANSAIQALASNNSGSSEPTTTYPFQSWADTANDLLKIRSADNAAWISVLKLSTGRALLSSEATSGPGSTPFSLRNKIINGDFSINQRGVSGTVTLGAGAYGHDRWKAGASGCTYTFATVNGLTTITISAGSLQQVIEDKNVPAGTNTLYLSWSGTAQGKIAAGSYGASGISASVTGGSNLTVEFGTGTLTSVQLEAGGITPFDRRPYGVELGLCQRYYEQLTGIIAATETAAASGLYSHCTWSFKATKRAIPTITYGAGSGYGGGQDIRQDQLRVVVQNGQALLTSGTSASSEL